MRRHRADVNTLSARNMRSHIKRDFDRGQANDIEWLVELIGSLQHQIDILERQINELRSTADDDGSDGEEDKEGGEETGGDGADPEGSV